MNNTINNQVFNKTILNIKISDIKFTVRSKKDNKKGRKYRHQILQNTKQHTSSTISKSSNAINRNSFIPKIYIKNKSQIQKIERFDFTPLDPAQVNYLKFPARKLKSTKPRSYFNISNQNFMASYNRHKKNTSCINDFQTKKAACQSKSCVLNVHPSLKSIALDNKQQKEQFTTYKNSKHRQFCKIAPKSLQQNSSALQQFPLDQRYNF